MLPCSTRAGLCRRRVKATGNGPPPRWVVRCSIQRGFLTVIGVAASLWPVVAGGVVTFDPDLAPRFMFC